MKDFLVDDETWAIRYLEVDTRNWWPGKKVLVSPQWIDNVSWPDSKVYVDLTRETIRNGPEWDESTYPSLASTRTGFTIITTGRPIGHQHLTNPIVVRQAKVEWGENVGMGLMEGFRSRIERTIPTSGFDNLGGTQILFGGVFCRKQQWVCLVIRP